MISLLIWLCGTVVGLWVGVRRGYIQLGGALAYDVLLAVWIVGGAAVVKQMIATRALSPHKTWKEIAALRAKKEAEAKARTAAEAQK
jgi:hypothetical protein